MIARHRVDGMVCGSCRAHLKDVNERRASAVVAQRMLEVGCLPAHMTVLIIPSMMNLLY